MSTSLTQKPQPRRTSQRLNRQNTYKFPDDDNFRTINFSGGRSSAYLLWHLLNANKGILPDTVRVIFCNTGKERLETLDFVQACQTNWNVPVHWLEFVYRPQAGGVPIPNSPFKSSTTRQPAGTDNRFKTSTPQEECSPTS